MSTDPLRNVAASCAPPKQQQSGGGGATVVVPQMVGRAVPPSRLLFVENEFLKIGVDPLRGACIAWISDKTSSRPGENLVNDYDCGRLVQQSFYGKEDGSTWNGNPWLWNPVQGGSWQDKPGNVIKCAIENGKIVTEANPRNWGSQDLVKDVVMMSEITLNGKHARVRFTMRYSGKEAHPIKNQELPATFWDRTLSKLVMFVGHPQNAWQNKPLTIKTPGAKNEYYYTPEGWAAYVGGDNRGVGIFTPIAQTLTCYRVGGNDGSTASCDCSYFGPAMRFDIRPGMQGSYNSFITCGTADEIRATFAGIRNWALTNDPSLLKGPGYEHAAPLQIKVPAS